MSEILGLEKRLWALILGGIIMFLLVIRFILYIVFLLLVEFGCVGGTKVTHTESNSKSENGQVVQSDSKSTTSCEPSKSTWHTILLAIIIVLIVMTVIQIIFTIILIVGALKMNRCLLTTWFVAAIIFCFFYLFDVAVFAYNGQGASVSSSSTSTSGKSQTTTTTTTSGGAFYYICIPPLLLLATICALVVVCLLRDECSDSGQARSTKAKK